MEKKDLVKYIEDNTVRVEISRRGGGIEIDLSDYLKEGYKMTAYQNCLGGGMLGKIANSYNFDTNLLSEKEKQKVSDISKELIEYFFELCTNEVEEYESNVLDSTLEDIQDRPLSAY